MASLTPRERRNAALLYAITASVTIGWWVVLVAYPQTRIHFLGSTFAEQCTWVLLAPDLISALVLATWLVPAILRNLNNVNAVAWLHAGGQGYAFAISVGLTLIDPLGYWGLIGMLLSSGIALFLAIRIQEINILWGKFKFKPAPDNSPKHHWLRSLSQTFWMWLIFLGLIPFLTTQFEHKYNLSQHWLSFPGQLPISIILFTVLGSVGLWAGYIMTHLGDGTPLPSEHATKLVVAGPYKVIRNPMAFCGTGQGVAVGLAMGSPLIIMYGILGALAWEILVRPLEEEQLLASFGTDYENYRKRVKCWIPTKPMPTQDKLTP